jgi:protein associated with RNAse G/E
MNDQAADSSSLKNGEDIRIVKLGPDGSEASSYSGTLIEAPPGWVVVRAVWTFRRMELGYMTFEPDDYLIEYFATSEPFNAFVLFSPEDEFKGWYCNITHPTTVRNQTVYWHDLYVDIIQKSDGTILILDEDELAESGLHQHDPALHQMIIDARDSVVEKMQNRMYPFSEFVHPSG